MGGGRIGAERHGVATLGSGPLPSIGSPSAFTTRPSQPWLGRTAAGASETSALQPRLTPSRPAKGMSSAWSPAKPTTSQGIGRAPVSTVTRAPTLMAWIGPDASIIRPRTPETRP